MVSKQFVEQIVAAKSLDKIMSTVLVSDTVQANNVADWLAKHRRDKEIGEEPFTLPPPGIQRFSTMSATGMVNYGEFLLIWDVFLDLVGRC
ncbi:hypothetical protein V6N13_127003 [Hibiscus sabdariffa]